MILELYKELRANVSNLLKNVDKIDELVKERSAEIEQWDSNTVYSQNTINEKNVLFGGLMLKELNLLQTMQ